MEANRILLASALSCIIICPNRVSRHDWIIAASLGCFVSLCTSSFRTNWCHLTPSSIHRHHWSSASILRASVLDIAQQSEPYTNIGKIQATSYKLLQWQKHVLTYANAKQRPLTWVLQHSFLSYKIYKRVNVVVYSTQLILVCTQAAYEIVKKPAVGCHYILTDWSIPPQLQSSVQYWTTLLWGRCTWTCELLPNSHKLATSWTCHLSVMSPNT